MPLRPRNPQTAQQGFLNRISLTSWIFIALIAGTMSNPFYAVLADMIQREAFRLG